MSHNVSLVCDAAPSPTRARGRCGDEARRSAEEPEAPSEAPMHIRAVMGSCAEFELASTLYARLISHLQGTIDNRYPQAMFVRSNNDLISMIKEYDSVAKAVRIDSGVHMAFYDIMYD